MNKVGNASDLKSVVMGSRIIAAGAAELFCASGNGSGSGVESDLRMRAVTERLVDGSATAAEGNFLSRFNLVSARVQKIESPGNQVWTFGQNLNSWIRHIFLLWS